MVLQHHFHFDHVNVSVKVTDNGPLILQSSTCLKSLLLNLKIHSVASFIKNLLKISFEQIGVNFL